MVFLPNHFFSFQQKNNFYLTNQKKNVPKTSQTNLFHYLFNPINSGFTVFG